MRGVLLVVAFLLAAGWSLFASEGDSVRRSTPASDGGVERAASTPARPRLEGVTPPVARPRVQAGHGATLEGRVVFNGQEREATLRIYRVADLTAPQLWKLIRSDPGPPLRVGQSAANGQFQFGGLPTGQLLLDARASDGARGTRRIDIHVGGQGVYVEVQLAKASLTLQGSAVDAAGEPWVGRVGVLRNSDRLRGVTAFDLVETDASGRFQLTALTPGPVRLVAEMGDRGQFRGPRITLPVEGPQTLVVHAGAVPVAGIVRDRTTKAPVVGVDVICGSRTNSIGILRSRTTTDADGRFRARAVAAGAKVGIGIEAPGFQKYWDTFPEGAETELEIELEPAVAIVGVTRSAADRTPRVGVLVHAYHKDDKHVYTTTSGADGRFRFDSLPEGSWRVAAWGPRWQSKDLGASGEADLGMLVGGRATEIDLPLVRGSRVHGRVLNAQGKPVAGAMVWSDPAGFSSWLSRLHAPWVRTDEAGRYVIDTLVPGVVNRLRARRHGWADGWSARFVRAVGSDKPIDIYLPVKRWLEVRLVGQDTSTPIVGAKVEVGNTPILHDAESATATSDARGVARVGPLRNGDLEVTVSAADFMTTSLTLAHDEVGLVRREMVLPRAFVISGRCAFADGAPAPDMLVWASRSGRRKLATTEADGSFSLEGLGAGDWELRIQPEIRWSTASKGTYVGTYAAGTRDLELSVHSSVTRPMRVRVTDPSGAEVSSFKSSSDRFSGARRRARGEYWLPTGHGYKWLLIYDAKNADGEELHLAARLVGPLDDGRTEIRAQLEPGRTVRGRIIDEQGRGIPGVPVSAHVKGQWWLGGSLDVHARSVSDDSGAFALRGLADFEYGLYAAPPDAYARGPEVTVRAGEDRAIIRLRRAARDLPSTTTTATLRVVDASGAAVSDARVKVRELSRVSFPIRTTDARGLYTFVIPDPDAEYTLDIRPPAGRLDLRALEVPRWTPADGEFELGVGLTIRGRVVDHLGQPVDGARVEAVRVDERLRERQVADDYSDEDGSFTLGHLPAGPITLLASYRPRGARVRREVQQEARAGDAQVELKLAAPTVLTLKVEGLPESVVGSRILLGGREPDGQQHWHRARLEKDLTARFEVHPRATYVLFRPYVAPGLVLFRGGIRGDSGTLTLQARRAGKLRVHVARPAGSTIPTVRLRVGGIRVDARRVAPGVFEFEALPEGTYEVTARAQTRTADLRATATGHTGKPLEIELR